MEAVPNFVFKAICGEMTLIKKLLSNIIVVEKHERGLLHMPIS